jgi:hypothetical protein
VIVPYARASEARRSNRAGFEGHATCKTGAIVSRWSAVLLIRGDGCIEPRGVAEIAYFAFRAMYQYDLALWSIV